MSSKQLVARIHRLGTSAPLGLACLFSAAVSPVSIQLWLSATSNKVTCCQIANALNERIALNAPFEISPAPQMSKQNATSKYYLRLMGRIG
jgi:hypothetical protein